MVPEFDLLFNKGRRGSMLGKHVTVNGESIPNLNLVDILGFWFADDELELHFPESGEEDVEDGESVDLHEYLRQWVALDLEKYDA